jgi:hypothetical protein
LKWENGVLSVGSVPTKLRDNPSSSASGVGVRGGGLNEKGRRDVVGSGYSRQREASVQVARLVL